MDSILPYFVQSYINSAKTFGLDLKESDLESKDLQNNSYVIFEIDYYGHATGFFRVVLENESIEKYYSLIESREKVFSLFRELMNQAMCATVAKFEEFEHSTIGLPRSFFSPINEHKVLIREASIFDNNTQSHINVYLHHDLRKTDLSKELEKQQQQTQMISLKANQLENEKMAMGSQKFEAIGQLAAGVAHEINTPIQFVSDNINFLKDSFNKFLESCPEDDNLNYFKEEIPCALDESKEGLERIANIVKSLKEFSHPGNDQIQHYPIKKLVDNCISLTRNEWKYVADVTADVADLKVHIYPNELSQVFVNMIINSAQSIEEKFEKRHEGKISIKFYQDNSDFVFEIEDNGSGIPQENVDKVFNPFFTTKEIGKGTGQGLAISRKIIENKHKGKIEILKNSHEGLCFKVIIREDEND